MDETPTQEKQATDTAEQSPKPGSDAKPAGARPSAGEPTPRGNHPDDPDHPTTAYDHIWYDRRPLH